MNSTIRAGIIGCGAVSSTHIEGFQSQQGVEVSWLCDIIEQKAATQAAAYNIENITTDYRQVLAADEVDCIVICTDHASHPEIAQAALEAGKHVLCEKALAATAEGMDAMCATHRKYPDLCLSGVFQHRFEHAPQLLKQCIEDGLFGRILTASSHLYCRRTNAYYEADNWRGTWGKEGGSALINQAIHYVDLLAWMMGGIKQVSGAYENLTHGNSIETEDTAAASCRFKEGALGTIVTTTSANLGWDPQITITGTEGTVEIRGEKVVRVVLKNKEQETELSNQLQEGIALPGMRAGKEYYGDGHNAQIADFIDAVRKRRQPFVTLESARHTVDVILAIYQSHQQNRWISI